MEKLVIYVPNAKSILVKQILKELGVTIQQGVKSQASSYKKKISQVSTWTEEDLKVFDESKKAFESLLPHNDN
ncbi:hypothetical protein SNE26_14340 [Mucilaginibacter sp. cycad4]|uniref:hypothetical protein n=1 Tax=Mucilaginibacter sp. cycad4 TaxID=3342096 RepID=UPI002AAAEE07|nr:hypothetical protein [Mucilaginibacter gossypii]WPU97203.1 hypothetical protein SNE26_14340 [Mucilaginibacter gossypii]